MSTIGKFLKDLKSTWYVFAIALLLVFCFSYFVALATFWLYRILLAVS